MGLIYNKIFSLFGIPSNVWSSFFVAFWLMNVLVSGVKVHCIVYCFSVDRGPFCWGRVRYTASILWSLELCLFSWVTCGGIIRLSVVWCWVTIVYVAEKSTYSLLMKWVLCFLRCIWRACTLFSYVFVYGIQYVFCVAPSVSDGILIVSACYETGFIDWLMRENRFCTACYCRCWRMVSNIYSLLLCIHH
jgi:hypothetical protein